MTLVLVVHHLMMGHTAVAAERLVEGVRSVPGATCISKPVLAEGVAEGDAAKREDFKDADALVLLPLPERGRHLRAPQPRLHTPPRRVWGASRQITPDRTRRQRRSPLLVSLERAVDGSRSLRSHRSAGRRGSRLHCA